MYPPALAGPLYPDGIPIVAEDGLIDLIRGRNVDEVVFAYSDLSHVEVMHRASIALAAGADFRLIGPRRTMLGSSRPVVAVCAARTGCGKSQTSRHIGRLLLDAGVRVALIRHPMPYGDLERMRVQRFAALADIDAAAPTVEEREEYEAPVRDGMVMYAGVDYADILRRAETEADAGYVPPDQLDFARWDNVATVSDPAVPADYWSPHRRIKQYRGGHDETWGGVTINIDNDQVDVAPVPTTPFGDYDRDGRPDLLARASTTGDLFVYLGTPGGVSGGRIRIGVGWNSMRDLVGVGDFNRDGYNDVIGVETATGLMNLYHGNGTALVRQFTIGSGWQSMRPLT